MNHSIPRPIAASSHVERVSASLDGQSAVALAYCTWWARRHGSVKPAPSVIVRRALQVYADHLSRAEGFGIVPEVHQLAYTGRGSGSALSLTEARARIEEHERASLAQPMRHWHDALHSQAERKESAEFLERLEASMA
jgi:hypothetical protein